MFSKSLNILTMDVMLSEMPEYFGDRRNTFKKDLIFPENPLDISSPTCYTILEHLNNYSNVQVIKEK